MVGASGCVGGVLESVVRLVAVVEGCGRARGDGDPVVVAVVGGVVRLVAVVEGVVRLVAVVE